MEKELITLDLSDFTPLELERIKKAAEEKQMTLEQYVYFLLKV